MKIKLFIIFSFLVIRTITAQVMWQVKETSSVKWYLRDDDEFNAYELNYDMWQNGYPWGPFAMSLDMIYKKENLEFDKGILAIITKKEQTLSTVNEWDIDKKYLAKYNKSLNDKGEYQFEFSGGSFSSRKRYKYGYFEIRLKINAETGMWPAFWLYGGNPNEEIDFYEGKGDRDNQIHIDVHCPNGCENYKGGFLNLKKNWGAWVKTDESLADGWNIISGEVEPGYVKFFLNGQAMGYFAGDFKTEQNLIINSAVAKNNEAFNPGPDENTKFPNSFLIDYVRVWSKEDTIERYRDNYKFFQNTAMNVENGNLYDTDVKRKVNYVYDKKALDPEFGTITLLPTLYNKFSLSVVGKKLGPVKVEVMDKDNKKVAGFNLENVEYYILDLSNLPTGPYTINVMVAGQTLSHNVPVIDPKNVGIQR